MTLKCDFDHTDKMFKCLIVLLSHAFLIILHLLMFLLILIKCGAIAKRNCERLVLFTLEICLGRAEGFRV